MLHTTDQLRKSTMTNARHRLDTISKVQDGGLWCSRVVIFNDFKDPLVKFKSVLHQMATSFETLGIYTICINGCQFKILLYSFKLAQLTSFESKISFELSTQKRG